MTEREFFIQRWAAELPATLAVIEALPGENLGYQPHPGCRTARSIVGHLLGHVEDLVELAGATGKIHHRNELPFAGVADAVEKMKQASGRFDAALNSVDEQTWANTNNQFVVDGHVHFEAPLGFTAWLLLFDTIHHRGQLSSYLRPMGCKRHPDIYGPSGDSGQQH